MPQKKNPDILELIRGRSAHLISALNTMFVLVKGLPHAYNRDLQEDKKPLFESVEGVSGSLEMMAGVISSITLNSETADEALEDEFIYATDIAEYLVCKGVAFADAHSVVGNIVKHCVDRGLNISDLSIAELKKFSGKLDEDVCKLLNSKMSVKNKKTFGSTNPEFVKKEISRWKKILQR
ncbi:MAG: argininosuccinate lyase, partial [Candidatus Omnitrophica bacterium]|nr:argininosuccinate lyase [Candidatus Omnitrophota bacterium]